MYVGYSEINRSRGRKEQRTKAHRREFKAEADNKLQNAYGPLLYRLEVAANEPAREPCRQEKRYVLTLGEMDEISSILSASRHLIAEDIFWYWEKRYQNSRWCQWNANEGSGAPVLLVTGYACDLLKMWQRTKSDYDKLMKQYEDNRL